MTTSLAFSELTARVKKFSRAELLRLDAKDVAEIDWTLKDARCAESVACFDRGPLYWLTRHTKTENPQHEAQGLPFLAPFPRKSYFVPLFAEFLARHSVLFIPQSRTMLSSWSAMGFATWAAQFRREETVVQTLNEDRAAHLIDYVRQLWDNQEDWLKARQLAQWLCHRLGGGGEVAAIASGADKIRALHPTTYVQDESAFLPDGEQSLAAVMPTGARIIAISSAHPGWFGDQVTL